MKKILRNLFQQNGIPTGTIRNILNFLLLLQVHYLNLMYLNMIFYFKKYFVKGYQWKNKLRYVRIYSDTPTMDTVTKDRAAKFVDMLSAIGGTMGLLTGFSIISGVEIFYFLLKFFFSLFRKRKNTMEKNI